MQRARVIMAARETGILAEYAYPVACIPHKGIKPSPSPSLVKAFPGDCEIAELAQRCITSFTLVKAFFLELIGCQIQMGFNF